MTDANTLISDGQNVYQSGYNAAESVSQGGTVPMAPMMAAGLAIAKDLGGDIAVKVASAIDTVESDAAMGATLGTLFGPEGTLIGTAVGAVVGVISSIEGLFGGGPPEDPRPLTVQDVDKVPLPIGNTPDPLQKKMAADLYGIIWFQGEMGNQVQESKASEIGTESFLDGISPSMLSGSRDTLYSVTEADVTYFLNALIADYRPPADGRQEAYNALNRFHRWSQWNCPAQKGPFGVTIPGGHCPFDAFSDPTHVNVNPGWGTFSPGDIRLAQRMACAAILGWSDEQVISYLMGMCTHWDNADRVHGTVTPKNGLLFRIGWIKSLLPSASGSAIQQMQANTQARQKAWIDHYLHGGPSPV